ncbi:DUF4360 domain-containing protein [Actinoplanes sp. NPDC023801]|uniref:DUF4360 domain-containing protein n=1 Tax=Actinoplanes sp. NPDC023801 TaxID=3154595 RepID=UPI00340EA89B
MLNILAAGAMALSSLTAPVSAPQQVNPPTEPMTISVGKVNGTGCKPGTATAQASQDNQAITISYSAYTAQVGPNVSPLESRKGCQLFLNVSVPSGYSFAIAKADYRGFAHLEKGASASHRAFYYFQGMNNSVTAERGVAGYYDDNWTITDEVGIESLNWSPCRASRYLVVNSSVQVNAGSSDPATYSWMTVDSADVSLDTIFQLTWKTCW